MTQERSHKPCLCCHSTHMYPHKSYIQEPHTHAHTAIVLLGCELHKKPNLRTIEKCKYFSIFSSISLKENTET